MNSMTDYIAYILGLAFVAFCVSAGVVYVLGVLGAIFR